MAFFEAGLFIPNTAIPTTLKHGYLTHIMGGNCRMAKHIQYVQAIQNCMKKVKAEYHNVIGLYHRKSAVFDVIRPQLLIKSSLPLTSAHAPALSGL